MSVQRVEACKRTLSETAERVLGCALDLEQPGSQDFFRVRLVTPTRYKIDIGYLAIAPDGKVMRHHITTTALDGVLEELPPEFRPNWLPA
jgi:hypothetical protein